MSRWTSVPAGLFILSLGATGAVADNAPPPGTATGAAAETNAACRQKPETGPCKGLFRIYYFDSAARTCKEFIWGGCQGSVPFKTLDECQKACLPPAQ